MLTMMDPAKAEEMKQQNASNQQQLNVIRTSGPGFVTQGTVSYLKQQTNDQSSVLILPKEYFYPISNAVRADLTLQNYLEYVPQEVRNDVLTVHLWHANWQ